MPLESRLYQHGSGSTRNVRLRSNHVFAVMDASMFSKSRRTDMNQMSLVLFVLL